ncbi:MULTISPECIES: hypothetical protein [unclassified Streptomyces]|uniref:hypothetical protein n=1 Tax=unclassified Streptomyces TaxID=2593676 RepID=UPI003426B611
MVQAAGASTWQQFEQAVARWFGQGDEERERIVLERLDRCADDLESAGGGQLDRVRISQQAAWQTRFEAALETLGDDEREQAAEELRSLLRRHTVDIAVSAGDNGQAIGGNVDIRADHGVAAWHIENVTMGNPPQPGPHHG